MERECLKRLLPAWNLLLLISIGALSIRALLDGQRLMGVMGIIAVIINAGTVFRRFMRQALKNKTDEKAEE